PGCRRPASVPARRSSDLKACPEFAMATIDELAEQGIVGSADVLPMPVAPERPLLSVRTRELVEMEADRNRWKTEAGELRARVAEERQSPRLHSSHVKISD